METTVVCGHVHAQPLQDTGREVGGASAHTRGRGGGNREGLPHSADEILGNAHCFPFLRFMFIILIVIL